MRAVPAPDPMSSIAPAPQAGGALTRAALVAPAEAMGRRALPSRRTVGIGVIAGLVTVAVATRADVAIATIVRDHSLPYAAKQLLEAVRSPGNFLFTIIVASLIVARSRDAAVGRARATLLLIASGVPSLAAMTIKWGIGRTRPFRGNAAFDFAPLRDGPLGVYYQKNLSFPSGDATLAFATAAAIGVMFPRLRGPAFAWATLVAVARVLQGAHYPSDVLAGAVLGTAASWAILAMAIATSRPADERPWPTAAETLAVRR